MATSKSVEAKKDQAMAAYDYGDDAGSGYESQSGDDIAIPFVSVLQSNSPQCADEDSTARPGMIYNTVTEEAVSGKEGLVLIPATTQHVFVEFVPRDEGGGFVGVHQVDSPEVKQAKSSCEFGQYKSSAGNELVETFYVYGVMEDDDGNAGGMAVLAFTSSKIKVYKRWNTKLRMFTINNGGRKIRPPLFAHRVRLTTEKEKNAKGEFFNFKLQPAEGDLQSSLIPPGDERMEAAKQCKDLIEGGEARASYETQEATSRVPGSDDDEPAPF